LRYEFTIVVTTHICSETADFWQKSYLPASLVDPILKTNTDNSILLNRILVISVLAGIFYALKTRGKKIKINENLHSIKGK
jgi:hypothetical protein